MIQSVVYFFTTEDTESTENLGNLTLPASVLSVASVVFFET